MREVIGLSLGVLGAATSRKILIPAVVLVTGWAVIVGEWPPFWFMVTGALVWIICDGLRRSGI